MAEYPFVFLYLLYITSYKKRAKVVEMRFFFVLLTKKVGAAAFGAATLSLLAGQEAASVVSMRGLYAARLLLSLNKIGCGSEDQN